MNILLIFTLVFAVGIVAAEETREELVQVQTYFDPSEKSLGKNDLKMEVIEPRRRGGSRPGGRRPSSSGGRRPGRTPGRSPGRLPGTAMGRAIGRKPGRTPGRSPGRIPGTAMG